MPSKPQLAAILLALAALPALAQQIDDPANLMGERVSPSALADTLPIDRGAPALEQLLRKLRTRASMMLIVAHPDDEDSGLLTYESRGRGARVAMLTLTRGEGGQNLMTGDFNDALGLIRTQELLAEDRYTGTDQFFGTEVDFGFSKTKEEAFRQWTHERVLYDAVRAVRLYRPLVLASVFIGGVTDGHGQHQVSGEITQEVFLAAADPTVFPEMGLPPWAPLRVYARVPFAPITAQGMFDYATGKYLPPHFHNYVTGVDTTTPPEATVTIHEGEVPNIPSFNGMSYVQWARQGLALQKTQIGPNFRIPPAGRVDVGYTLYGTRFPASKGCPMIATASTSLSWEQAVEPCLNLAPKAVVPAANTPEDQDLFTGIDTSLTGITDLAPHAPTTLRPTLVAIDLKTAEAQKLFDPDHPELTAPPLGDALKQLDALITQTEAGNLPALEKFNLLHELRVKRVQFNNALVLALGISVGAQLDTASPQACTSFLVQGCIAKIETSVRNDGKNSINLSTDFFSYTGDSKDERRLGAGLLAPGKAYKSSVEMTDGRGHDPIAVIPKAKQGEGKPSNNPSSDDPEARPYFTRPNIEQPFYNISRPALRLAPATPTQSYFVRFEEDGVALTAATMIQAAGPRMQPLVLVPNLSVEARPRGGIVLPDQKSYPVAVHLVNNGTPFPGAAEGVRLLPEGWSEPRIAYPFTEKKSETSDVTFSVLAGTVKAGQSYTSQVEADGLVGKFAETVRPVGYPGLTYTNYYTSATFTATAVDVTTASDLRVAYLPGTGDDVPLFLPSLGVTPTLLTTKDLTAENLKQYDAVLLGVRAYSAHPELKGTGSAPLNDYAKQGGIVIVQYSSAGFDPASAPYPYTVPGDSAHNVVDEDQPVRLLAPDNPLLTWPNKITSADFDQWIEERGHGFASDWSPEYTPLVETHDPDQDPQKGGLLLAKVGKGAYIYCAFALYRQLPEGVPGAYRLLANLLSYAKNPGR
jgi:LmbE family N-acetylglucosaminyl deacetylase